MHYFTVLGALLPLASALVLPHETPECTTFTESLDLNSYNATLLNATYYPVNSLNVSNTYNTISFCEIYTSIAYGTGNNTLIAATWLPDRLQYNDRFMAVGNGGMAGTIDYPGMMTQLNSGMGFVVAGGDAGHRASDNNGGNGEAGVYLPYLHDREQVEAWIHDAISLFTPAAKALTAAYYGKDANYSFYNGCSTGGAQGMALAQYHPELFDGIVAGCPGNWYSHLALSFLWNAQHTAVRFKPTFDVLLRTDTLQKNASTLSQSKLNLTTTAVLDACDLNDGVADRVLENPLACTFNISTIACNSTTLNTSTCLTAPELLAAKAIYAGPSNSQTSTPLYPGFTPGSEIEWSLQQGPLSSAFSIPILQNLVYDNLSYNPSTFNWASNVADLDANAGALIDATSPNLTTFFTQGSKLLISQGWADPFNAATWPIEHLERIKASTEMPNDKDVSDFLNLFMVPGGGHCGAATHYPQVPATYHTVAAMVKWVERGEKPGEVLSSDPPDGSGRTRKLCAWPATARWVGGVEDWGSWVCE
jgi:feruloyl esterase